MKQLQLDLNKRLLIVELHKESEFEIKKEGIFIKLFGKYQTDIIRGDFTFICKGSNLNEEIAINFVEESKYMDLDGNSGYVDYKVYPEGLLLSPIESFISAIESKNYHWGENPVKFNDDESDIGKRHKNRIDWERAESKTFNPSQCIIFEIV